MATLLKVLNNLADIKSAGGVALRVRTQGACCRGGFFRLGSKRSRIDLETQGRLSGVLGYRPTPKGLVGRLPHCGPRTGLLYQFAVWLLGSLHLRGDAAFPSSQDGH